jgi:hypothetical protein
MVVALVQLSTNTYNPVHVFFPPQSNRPMMPAVALGISQVARGKASVPPGQRLWRFGIMPEQRFVAWRQRRYGFGKGDRRVRGRHVRGSDFRHKTKLKGMAQSSLASGSMTRVQ